MTAEPPPGLAGDLDVLAFAEAELTAGRPAALATIIALDGPFSRPLGAQLAIAADRRFSGSISGGCLEQALTEEAADAIAQGACRVVRYGTGSPYLDVRLPCGGGLDIHIDPAPPLDVLRQALAAGRNRQVFGLGFDPAAEHSTLGLTDPDSAASSNRFVRRFQPRLRLVLAGRGWEIVAMSRHARMLDCEIVVASQENATLDFCQPFADQLVKLTTPAAVPSLPLDADTAVASLFHEHEWEAALLLDALRSPAFYVGALGSRQTAERRIETLRELGAGPDDIARLRGPIGLFPARDPQSVALSALAEIVSLRTGPPGAL